MKNTIHAFKSTITYLNWAFSKKVTIQYKQVYTKNISNNYGGYVGILTLTS